MKKLVWLLVLLACAAAVWYAYLGGAEKVSKLAGKGNGAEQRLSSFEEKNKDFLITYNDPKYGFSIKYPIGYEVLSAPDFGVYIRFAAHMAGYYSEVIDLKATESASLAKSAFYENLRGFSEKELLTKTETVINGRKAFVFKARKQFEEIGSPFYITEAFFECADSQNKTYSLSLVATVPEELLADAELVHYMVYSLKF